MPRLVLASAAFALTLTPPALLAQATNFVTNGGFEDGTYPATVGGYQYSDTPNGWTPNAAFNEYGYFDGYNAVTTEGRHALPFGYYINDPTPYSGAYELRTGNGDGEPLATLSQTFSDNSGASYSGSVWIYYGGNGGRDPDAFFDVLIGNTPLVTLNDNAPAAWTDYTFTFTGTGSDTLTIEGQTNPNEWYVDNVSVTGAAGPTNVPEGGATGLYLLLAAVACSAAMLFRSLTIKKGPREELA
jgi:hypothetical protein